MEFVIHEAKSEQGVHVKQVDHGNIGLVDRTLRAAITSVVIAWP